MNRDDIPVPAPASWSRPARSGDSESAVAAAVRQHLVHGAGALADPLTDSLCEQVLVNDTTERFPRWARRPEPNALPYPGPRVIPCSRLSRWYLALMRWLG